MSISCFVEAKTEGRQFNIWVARLSSFFLQVLGVSPVKALMAGTIPFQSGLRFSHHQKRSSSREHCLKPLQTDCWILLRAHDSKSLAYDLSAFWGLCSSGTVQLRLPSSTKLWHTCSYTHPKTTSGPVVFNSETRSCAGLAVQSFMWAPALSSLPTPEFKGASNEIYVFGAARSQALLQPVLALLDETILTCTLS